MTDPDAVPPHDIVIPVYDEENSERLLGYFVNPPFTFKGGVHTYVLPYRADPDDLDCHEMKFRWGLGDIDSDRWCAPIVFTTRATLKGLMRLPWFRSCNWEREF